MNSSGDISLKVLSNTAMTFSSRLTPSAVAYFFPFSVGSKLPTYEENILSFGVF